MLNWKFYFLFMCSLAYIFSVSNSVDVDDDFSDFAEFDEDGGMFL